LARAGAGDGAAAPEINNIERLFSQETRAHLSVERGGVVLGPEDVEEDGVGAGVGVVVHAHHLGVARAAAADVAVGRGVAVALRVPDLRARHAGEALVRQLHAPEAARRELRQGQALARRRVPVRRQRRARRVSGGHGGARGGRSICLLGVVVVEGAGDGWMDRLPI